jgi:ankyrin repeat protein
MKTLFRHAAPLLGWVVLGLALVPGILWLVHEYLPAAAPGLQATGFIAFYLDFYRGQAGIGNWLWVLAPYLLYQLVRSRTDTRELRGCTPLGLAAFKGDLARIKALLGKGTDINGQDSAGRTALHLAVLNERVEVVRTLLEAGADVDITDQRFGFRPLHFSARKGNAGVCELLVRYGADLDAQSLRGKTALHLAVINGNLAVVTILLKYLARVDICDNNNKTPLQYAEAKGHTEIVSLIREHVSDTWAYLQLVNS